MRYSAISRKFNPQIAAAEEIEIEIEIGIGIGIGIEGQGDSVWNIPRVRMGRTPAEGAEDAEGYWEGGMQKRWSCFMCCLGLPKRYV